MIKPIEIDGQKFITPTWEEMGEICFGLAKKVDFKYPHKFDRLIALAKGGLAWSRTIADYLAIKNMSSFQICFYTDIATKDNKPIIIQSLPVDVSSETVLIFDDITDSGETLGVAKKYLTLCGAKKVITATIFIKTWTKKKPDFFGYETNAWIIFPNETRETINLLSKKWEKEHLSPTTIRERLIGVGLPKEQVNFFLR